MLASGTRWGGVERGKERMGKLVGFNKQCQATDQNGRQVNMQFHISGGHSRVRNMGVLHRWSSIPENKSGGIWCEKVSICQSLRSQVLIPICVLQEHMVRFSNAFQLVLKTRQLASSNGVEQIGIGTSERLGGGVDGAYFAICSIKREESFWGGKGIRVEVGEDLKEFGWFREVKGGGFSEETEW